MSIPVCAAHKDYSCKYYYCFIYFRSEHKFDVPTGHATFWNHIVDSVDFLEDNLKVPKVTNAHVDTLYKNKTPIKRCVCSNVNLLRLKLYIVRGKSWSCLQ